MEVKAHLYEFPVNFLKENLVFKCFIDMIKLAFNYIEDKCIHLIRPFCQQSANLVFVF